MNITIKNVSYNARLSEETSCFTATVCVDGKKVGEASNRGCGGSTSIVPYALDLQIGAYAKTLPATKYEGMILDETSDSVIDGLLNEFLLRRDMVNAMRKKLVFTKSDKPGIYTTKPLTPEKLKAYISNPATPASFKVKSILNALPESEAFAIYKANIGAT